MKKLLIYIIAVLATVCVLDFGAGLLLSKYLRTHQLPGDCAAIDYTIKSSDEDVVIVGNSVILNSLMPEVLQDSLGVSVYNSASNGQQLAFFYSILDCILSRYTPEAVILGLREDLFSARGIGDRYSILSPYYEMGYEVIDSCLNSTSSYAPYFMKSTFYRYNMIWWRILLYHFITPNEQGANGFIAKPIPPIFPTLLPMGDSGEPEEECIRLLDKIVRRCNDAGVKLVAIYPPLLYEPKEEVHQSVIKEMLLRKGVAVIDDSSNPYYLKHPELFYDNTHLNKDGALIYSREKASALKDILKK